MSRHTTRKISTICSEKAFNWLQNWLDTIKFPTAKYKLQVKDCFYKKTNHRQYLSKWLEKVMYDITDFEGYAPRKLPDTGKQLDNTEIVTNILGQQKTIGSKIWIKKEYVRPGTADIICFFRGSKGLGIYNMEVKVGKDQMSTVQKIEQQRAERAEEFYNIIKTLDDFLDLYKPNWKNE